MYQSARTVNLNAPASDVWALVGDFFGLSNFHPMISKTHHENYGLWRRDMFGDVASGSLEERLHHSDRSMSYSYRSINAGGGAWPVDSYFGKFKVWSQGPDTAGVLWAGQMIPSDPEADMAALVGQLVENQTVGLGGLVDRFGGSQGPSPDHDFAAHAVAHLDAEPDEVWALVGDFFRIAEWITTVKSVEMVSNGRRFVGQHASDHIDVETELFRSDTSRTLSYDSRLEPGSAYPCDDYIANLKVWPRASGGSGLVWSAQVTPSTPEDTATVEKVIAMMGTEYTESLAGLVDRFGGAMAQRHP